MKQFFTRLLLLAAILAPKATVAQGTVQNLSMYSNALGATEQFQIYLPEGYDPGGTKTYPVVYFLHGSTFNSTGYPCLLDSVDALIESGEISPVIVVKPDGNQGPYLGSMYTNSSLNGDVEDFIIADLIPYIDANYKTKADRQHRSIFGHSMGAMGSGHLALKYPDKFRAFAAISGAMDFSQIDLFFDFALAVEHPSGPPYTFAYNPASQLLTGLIFTAASGYSPNPGNVLPVFFPLDAQGELVDSVMEKWSEFDPALRVVQSPPDSTLGIYVDCGQQDEFKFYPMNLSFRDSLQKAGVNHVFKSFQGGHSNKICERMALAMRYLDSMMLSPIVAAPEIMPYEKVAIFPNPTSGLLHLVLPEDMGDFTVRIFDILGKTVLQKRFSSFGSSQVSVELNGLASGAYFIELNIGGNRGQARKFVVRAD
jgi:enterochelin esterase-like enzyme